MSERCCGDKTTGLPACPSNTGLPREMLFFLYQAKILVSFLTLFLQVNLYKLKGRNMGLGLKNLQVGGSKVRPCLWSLVLQIHVIILLHIACILDDVTVPIASCYFYSLL